MDRAHEVQFENMLLDAVEQAIQLGYQPNRFVRMIHSRGGFQTVKDIVAGGTPSEGFNKLVLLGRTDLTCEAIIVESRWRMSFDADLLAIAEQRLTQYGYAWTPFRTEQLEVQVPPPDETTEVIEADEFDPPSDDHRERELRATYRRSHQGAFRDALIRTYGARCVATGLEVAAALEAAHITAYRGERSNHVQNGLLLRADLHALFDKFMLAIDPRSMRFELSEWLRDEPTYANLQGQRILLANSSVLPSRRALEVHWREFVHSSAEISN